MIRTLALVLSLGALGACATTGGGGTVASAEQAAISDAEQIGVSALAQKLGVGQSSVASGLSLAKSVYNGGGHTAQSKEAAVQQGASKVLANAKAEGKTLTSDQSSVLTTGLRDLLQ